MLNMFIPGGPHCAGLILSKKRGKKEKHMLNMFVELVCSCPPADPAGPPTPPPSMHPHLPTLPRERYTL